MSDRATALECPQCRSRLIKGDFDPDVGKWLECMNCGYKEMDNDPSTQADTRVVGDGYAPGTDTLLHFTVQGRDGKRITAWRHGAVWSAGPESRSIDEIAAEHTPPVETCPECGGSGRIESDSSLNVRSRSCRRCEGTGLKSPPPVHIPSLEEIRKLKAEVEAMPIPPKNPLAEARACLCAIRWVAPDIAKAREMADRGIEEATEALGYNQPAPPAAGELPQSRPELVTATAHKIFEYLESANDAPYRCDIDGGIEPILREAFASHPDPGCFSGGDAGICLHAEASRERVRELEAKLSNLPKSMAQLFDERDALTAKLSDAERERDEARVSLLSVQCTERLRQEEIIAKIGELQPGIESLKSKLADAESERDTWKASYLDVVEGEPAKTRQALMDKAIEGCRILRERAEAAEQRLERIASVVKADADDLDNMRDGTKLTRAGLVETIAYWHEEAGAIRQQAHEQTTALRERVADAERRAADLSFLLRDTAANVLSAPEILSDTPEAAADKLTAGWDALVGRVDADSKKFGVAYLAWRERVLKLNNGQLILPDESQEEFEAWLSRAEWGDADDELTALRDRVVMLRAALTLCVRELDFCVNVAGRKGGKYEEALNAARAALAPEAMATKRKPLAERVTWRGDTNRILSCNHGGVFFYIDSNKHGTWFMACDQFSIRDTFIAVDHESAKAEALRIVQAAVIAAAAEWED